MMEKRKQPRRACLQGCVWTLAGCGTLAQPARIINCSPCGMLLETDELLPVGTPVRVIRSAGHGRYGDEDQETACFLGIVRWSARQPGDISCCHGAGIEIVRQV